jgi:hypothetical protein
MIKAIPQEWLDVLKEVHAVFPSAVIAGGALRDLMHERPIKDVDIFIPVHKDYVGALDNAFEAIWDLFAGEDCTLDPDSQYGVHKPEEADRDLYAIFKLNRRYKYDLILCTPDAARIDTFDINICQITCDGKHVKMTGAFAHGFLTKTLKVMNVNRTDRNAARMERIALKYPDYTVEANDV